MKRKPLLLLSLFLLSTLACRKEPEPDIPCNDFIGFTCLVNGEPFKTEGNLRCAGFSKWYNPDTGYLVISGRNCNPDAGEVNGVSFNISEMKSVGFYSDSTFTSIIYYRSETGSVDYDSTLSGQVSITGFVEDNYSADFTNGYVEGRFEFTQYNDQLKDTAYITNGRFCMRF